MLLVQWPVEQLLLEQLDQYSSTKMVSLQSMKPLLSAESWSKHLCVQVEPVYWRPHS